MPTHPRKQLDDTQIVAEILKDAAEPRQAASVRDAFEKKSPPSVATKTRGGTKGGKTRAAKARVSR